RREHRIARSVTAARERMWHEPTGMFHAIRRDGSKIQTITVGAFMMLLAEVPTAEQAQRMLGTLATPQWMTPNGVHLTRVRPLGCFRLRDSLRFGRLFAAYLTRSAMSLSMASMSFSGVTVPSMTRWNQSVTMVKR
ncbi:MAG: hypothetical protein RL261_1238, partial [Pseudomonadota bacterium]